MNTIVKRLTLLSITLGVFAFGVSSLQAASTATLFITQISPWDHVYGDWTLIYPDNEQLEVINRENYEINDLEPGTYSLLFDRPQGAITEIRYAKNGELLEEKDVPQVTFTVEEGDLVNIDAEYTFTEIGGVSVSTEPPGIRFELLGPNNLRFRGTSPQKYDDVPFGLYSVTFDAIEGCTDEVKKSDQLQTNGRISLAVVYSCEGLEEQLDANYEKKLTHVTMQKDGKTIVLEDVPMDSWFASYVFAAAKTGIVGGYERNGEPTGKYGPSDNVNVAQLLKIAHGVAGLDESKYRTSAKNSRAHNTWFEQYFVSSEKKSWVLTRDPNLDPGRNVTRGEVVATFLQAFDVPRYWPKGEMFRDVSPVTKYAASIETAVAHGLVEGYDDGTFRPKDPVNRAEIAKMISNAIDIYVEKTANIQPDVLDQ